MKQVHNVRVKVTDSNEEFVKQILAIFSSIAASPEQTTVTMTQDGEEWTGELRTQNQQPVRRILKALQTGFSPEDKLYIRTHPHKLIDTVTHCYLHLDKEKLLSGEYALAKRTEFFTVRLNLACWPVTKENACEILKEVFD